MADDKFAFMPKPDPSDVEGMKKWKAQQFGDSSLAGKDKRAGYDQMLVDRHHAGLPLTKDARRRVRQLLKE